MLKVVSWRRLFDLFLGRWNDTLLYVYTSGTTGLPKASKISHLRFFSAAALFSVTARLRYDDR